MKNIYFPNFIRGRFFGLTVYLNLAKYIPVWYYQNQSLFVFSAKMRSKGKHSHQNNYFMTVMTV